ncbi:hypothetical protein [Clostridioides difficile]|uniref:hypothetical protein n=1 Tax=Clostridioides difficile TaxID=1496 RepID=UPI001F3B608C|nr:hypothetical protein [Clostridioides difficile]
MRKWNKFKSERGAALVLVLVVVALLSIVGLIFSNQIANRIKSTKTTNEGIQAKYLQRHVWKIVLIKHMKNCMMSLRKWIMSLKVKIKKNPYLGQN